MEFQSVRKSEKVRNMVLLPVVCSVAMCNVIDTCDKYKKRWILLDLECNRMSIHVRFTH